MVTIISILIISFLWFLNCIFAELAASALSEHGYKGKGMLIKAAIPFYNIWLVYKKG